MCGRRVAGWPLHGEASQTVEMKPKKLYLYDSQSSRWSQFSVAVQDSAAFLDGSCGGAAHLRASQVAELARRISVIGLPPLVPLHTFTPSSLSLPNFCTQYPHEPLGRRSKGRKHPGLGESSPRCWTRSKSSPHRAWCYGRVPTPPSAQT
jgi:hypothetical protein